MQPCIALLAKGAVDSTRAAHARAGRKRERLGLLTNKSPRGSVKFKTRLAAYHRDTAAVRPYYAAKGMVQSVDGMQPIVQVTEAIDRILERAQA
jgi:adenylate kinase family enzyme